jgi:hypothetical protein
MTQTLHSPEHELKTMGSLLGGAIPDSLKAEYKELFLKREQLRAELGRARAELATLRAKEKGNAL